MSKLHLVSQSIHRKVGGKDAQGLPGAMHSFMAFPYLNLVSVPAQISPTPQPRLNEIYTLSVVLLLKSTQMERRASAGPSHRHPNRGQQTNLPAERSWIPGEDALLGKSCGMANLWLFKSKLHKHFPP